MNRLILKWILILIAVVTVLFTILNITSSAVENNLKAVRPAQLAPQLPPKLEAVRPAQEALQPLPENEADKYFFVIMTKSLPQHEDDRKLLREKSWLSHDWKDDEGKNISWTHVFFVGLSMDEAWTRKRTLQEHAKYGDIVIIPTLDMQTRLTFKLMKGLQHAIDHYKFTFLIVVDEDTIVNVNGLNRHLRGIVESGKESMFYGGYECGKKQVFRGGKFANSVEKWPPNTYPRFCTGTGVIYSYDTIVELCNVWDNDRQPNLDIDDTHQGVLIWMSGKIEVTEISNITRGCFPNRGDTFIVTQIQPLTTGVKLMDSFLENGIYCNTFVRGH